MPRNIEIKARVDDLVALEARAAALATTGPAHIAQDDTFFPCRDGRLKLRTFSPTSGELIAYVRPDAAGPKTSAYQIVPTAEPDRLRDALAAAHGIAGRVRKQRTLYLAGRTRIHLDRVEGLGDFVELEVVLSDGEPESQGVAEAQTLMTALGVSPSDLVEGAYVDLLTTRPAPAPAHPFDTEMPPWRVLASRHLLQDRWLSLRADTCALPDGPTLDPYYVLEERDWVHVFALDDEGRVPVVRQYRHAAGVATIELPGGIVDDGETPLEAARRELREETGHEAAHWRAIGTCFANPARQTNRVHLFLATGLSPAGALALDEGEQVEAALASVDQIRGWIEDGRWSQSMHIASFHLALEAASSRDHVDAGGGRVDVGGRPVAPAHAAFEATAGSRPPIDAAVAQS